MDMHQVTVQVETDFIKILIQLLRSAAIKVADAKKITRELLALLPFADDEDLDKKLKTFTDTYPAFKQIYISTLKTEDEKKVGDLLAKMRRYIKEDKIDEALELVK